MTLTPDFVKNVERLLAGPSQRFGSVDFPATKNTRRQSQVRQRDGRRKAGHETRPAEEERPADVVVVDVDGKFHQEDRFRFRRFDCVVV